MSIFVEFANEESEIGWGMLVKSWVKGTSEFLGIPADQFHVPRDLADLKDQCAIANVQVTIPETYTKIAVVQHGPGTLVVRLPEKGELETAENLLAGGADYRLARFYRTFLGPLDAETLKEKQEFQAGRIGDYAIATCM